MTVRRVLEWPHASLSKPARAIAPELFGTEEIYQHAADLRDTVTAHRAAGLAACQIGVDLAMFVLVGPTGPVVICNPIVGEAEGSQTGIEGCLSFRSVGWPMRAPMKIPFRFHDEDGTEHHGVADGREARAFFHEFNHTLGKTMLDRMAAPQRGLFLRAVAKARHAR